MDLTLDLPPRHLDLEGVSNFRDMGGYRGHGGRAVRWGRLFRSGNLHRLTPGDRQRLAPLGLALVVDFRQRAEQEREPSAWDPASAPRTCAAEVVPGSAESFFRATGDSTVSLDRTAEFMAHLYRDMVVNQTAAWRAMFEGILATREGAVLMHCAAGKDRTGFAGALVLSALGVAWEDVTRDYLLTARYQDPDEEMARVLRVAEHLVKPPMSREVIRPMFEVRPAYLAAAREELEARWGSVDAYLTRELGLGPAERRTLEARYLA
ncbi:tyrosine-protein phosphatase [Mesoterricola sediminis]|uniref:Protein-tyrosine-phosphatase n=1 Tax=Mesoterricola sediminis TaxID=2927980 RepID=A0AA48GWE0_9BACT|nr:tyrosine-protein phosphatase [Mesoterricola sediminis]BDU76885.1 protein-tyrosine-phosphatase [Mesoterricola sediminis]